MIGIKAKINDKNISERERWSKRIAIII